MAWAGFVKPDPNPYSKDYPVQGEEDRLLLQVKSAGLCTGKFIDATIAKKFPAQGDMSRDIDVIDVNGDKRPDLYVTNARFAPGNPLIRGADFNDRLLVNSECSPGSGIFGCFVDEALARLPPPPDADPHNSTTVCDVDGDGDPDVISANQTRPNRLLINDGAGKFTDESIARGVAEIGILSSHDVACADWFNPQGGPQPDGYPELVFAQRGEQKNRLLLNQGQVKPGFFKDASMLLPNVNDTSSAVAICDLENDKVPEILFGNGDVNTMFSQSNRVLRLVGGFFQEADVALGFRFTGPAGVAASTAEGGVTEEVECGDLDGDGVVDVVGIG